VRLGCPAANTTELPVSPAGGSGDYRGKQHFCPSSALLSSEHQNNFVPSFGDKFGSPKYILPVELGFVNIFTLRRRR